MGFRVIRSGDLGFRSVDSGGEAFRVETQGLL